jgi:hypothetical protein
MNLNVKEKKIIEFYEKNNIPYHYIWYFIKNDTKTPINEYNKAEILDINNTLKKQIKTKYETTIPTSYKVNKKYINLTEEDKESLKLCVSGFVKHTQNIYVIDIDDETIKSPTDLPNIFSKLYNSIYINGNTKGIHIYVKINGLDEYSCQQDVLKYLKGDLIRQNNIWERCDKSFIYGNDFNIIELEWNDIKHWFDLIKMNFKNNINDDNTIKTIDLYNSQSNINQKEENDNSSIVSSLTDIENKNKIDLLQFRKYIDGLSVERSDNYNYWTKIIWGIYNTSKENKWSATTRNQIIHTFSKKSSKYDEEIVDNFIENNIKDDKEGIGVGTIIQYYKEDNPNEVIGKNNYEIMKEDFEKKNFMVLYPLKYCSVDSFGKLHRNDKTTFLNLYENLFVEIEINNNGGKQKKNVKFINKWLEDPQKRKYEKIDFLPKQNYDKKLIYNTFTSFEVEKKKLEKTKEELMNSCLIKHIKKLFVTDENYDYFIKWLSIKLKYPHILTGVALILMSTQGTGKDTLFNYIGNNIIGSKYYANDDKIDLFFGRFNSLIEDKILCVINETSLKGTCDIGNIIKNSLTKNTNLIEYKGQTPFDNTNHINWVFLTNSSYPLKIEESDRRFWAIECGNEQANDFEYFKKLNEELKSGLYDKIFYEYLMEQDVENYDFVNNRPKTKYYNMLKQMSTPIIAIYLKNIIDKNFDKNEIEYKSNDLYLKFTKWKNSFGYENYNCNLTIFGNEIKKYNGIIKKRKEDGNFIIIDFKILNEYLLSKNYII